MDLHRSTVAAGSGSCDPEDTTPRLEWSRILKGAGASLDDALVITSGFGQASAYQEDDSLAQIDELVDSESHLKDRECHALAIALVDEALALLVSYHGQKNASGCLQEPYFHQTVA